MTCFFADCSDYDWTRGSFDVASMAADGIVALTHKATEATSIKHVHLADALNRGRAAGIPILGAYHVVRSSPGVQAQVAYFLSYLDSAVPWWRTWPGFILQVDLEKWSYDPVTITEAPNVSARSAARILAWPMSHRDRVRAAGTGSSFTAALKAAAPDNAFVVVYASKGQYGDSLVGIGAPLWNANYPSTRTAAYRTLYTGDNGAGWSVYSGQTPMFWQYASSATIGSQPGCDINAYRGTLAQLQSVLGGGTQGEFMATASDVIMAWAMGLPATADNTQVSPVIWRIRDETWQAKINATVTALTGASEARDAATLVAIKALADAIASGGGTVDSVPIIAAIQAAAADAASTTAALKSELDAAIVALDAASHREADLRARLATALGQ